MRSQTMIGAAETLRDRSAKCSSLVMHSNLILERIIPDDEVLSFPQADLADG